ncbi:MAG: hypothetical protein OXN18_09695 [Gemmatimonadota bacterium]|nr:hypothetical protein [Gemmatimonadota bacterium]
MAVAAVPQQEAIELPVDDVALRAEFDESFRIDDGLTLVSSIGFDEHGNLNVGDYASGGGLRIITITPSGERSVFGVEGPGPGEFVRATGMVALADGRMVVPDLGRRAFQRYEPDGAFTGLTMFGELPGPANMVYRPYREGGLLARVRIHRTSEMDSLTISNATIVSEGPRVVFAVDLGGVAATLRVLAEGRATEAPSFVASTTLSGIPQGRPVMEGSIHRTALLPRLLFDALPGGGLVVADTSAYLLTVYDEQGAVQRTIRRALPPRPVTEAMRRRFRGREFEVLEDLATARSALPSAAGRSADLIENLYDMERASIESLQFGSEVPLIDDLLVTWDGMIWVRRTPTDAFPHDGSINPLGYNAERTLQDMQAARGAARIDVLTADGRYCGTTDPVRWPAAVGPGGLAAYIDVTELEVPIVLIGRLLVPPCGER